MSQRPSARGSRWQVASATALGAGHVRNGLPNQDSHGHRQVEDVLVLVVADGHGGRRYVRSDRGSRFAVETALDLAEVYAARSPEEIRAVFPAAMVEQWRARVQADHEAHPFEAEELERAGVALDDRVTIAYGSTCVIALLRPDGILVLQVGDGDVVVQTSTGTVLPVAGDERLLGNITTSLCTPGAVADFRFGWVNADREAHLVFVASDGYGNSFAASAWESRVAADFATQVAAEGWSAVRDALPRWAADSARVGGDDVSIVLAVRPSGSVGLPADRTEVLPVAGALALGGDEQTRLLPTPAPGPAPTESLATGEPTRARSRSARSRTEDSPPRGLAARLLVPGLLVLALATGGTAYALLRAQPDAIPSPTPSATPSPVTTSSRTETVPKPSPTPTPSTTPPGTGHPGRTPGPGPSTRVSPSAPAPSTDEPATEPAPPTPTPTGPTPQVSGQPGGPGTVSLPAVPGPVGLLTQED